MIFNMVGGAGGGKDGAATLTVQAPINTNITVSKDTKSYTKNSGSTGVGVFQGLTTGQWAVSISNAQQTQTRTINITTTYSMAIAFFAATINITYPAGSTCTVSKGDTVFSAPDTSGTWDCVVPNTGTWTVTCTDGELIDSENVSITADGQTKSVTLAYFTATINITYPATSTCTVTNSNGVTIATDTNATTSTKTFIATVHAIDTYTVIATATDGSGKTRSTTASITADGQSMSVTLRYTFDIFREGEGVSSGYAMCGWYPNKDSYNNGWALSNEKIIWATDSTVGNQVWVIPSINVSEYSALKIDFKCTGRYSTSAQKTVTIGVGPDVPSAESYSGSYAAKTDVPYSTARAVRSVDLSGITASTKYYIKLDAFGITGEIYNIWFE